MKITKKLIQKIQAKMKTLDEEVDFSYLLDFVVDNEDWQADQNHPENDEKTIEFLAIGCKSSIDNPRMMPSYSNTIQKAGFSGDAFKKVYTLFQEAKNLDKIVSITDERTFFVGDADENEYENEDVKEDVKEDEIEKEDVETIAISIPDLEEEQPNGKFTADGMLNRAFLRAAINRLEEDEFQNLVSYDANERVPISEAIDLKLASLPSADGNHHPEVQAEAAQTLLCTYTALEQRSQNRKFTDILKHPFKTFGEWLAKGRVKKELQNRTGINGAQLETLAKLTGMDDVKEDFAGIGKSGEILTSPAPEQPAKEEPEEKIDYEQINRDVNDSFENSMESEPVSEENEPELDRSMEV